MNHHTQTILIKGVFTPEQRNTILGAAVWIERLCERKEMLPASFLAGNDPAPLAVKLREMIKDTPTEASLPPAPLSSSAALTAAILRETVPVTGTPFAMRETLQREHAALEEWIANPAGNSATANLRNELCKVIGEREDLRLRVTELETVAELAAGLDTGQDCDPSHHELVIAAMESMNSETKAPSAALLRVPVWNPLDDGIKGRPLMVSAADYNRAVSKVEELEAALEKLKQYTVGTLEDGVKDLSCRIKVLEAALEKLKQYTVCNCPEDEETGKVQYHSNCHRHGRKIIDEALNPTP